MTSEEATHRRIHPRPNNNLYGPTLRQKSVTHCFATACGNKKQTNKLMFLNIFILLVYFRTQ